MSRENEKARLFTRRALILGAAQAGFFSLLAGRLYYLQIIKGDIYRTLAEENRINLRLLPPPRGHILDRNGIQLATNQQNYRLVILPEQVKDIKNLVDNLRLLLGLNDAECDRIERDFRNSRKLDTILARDNLTWDQVAAVSLHSLDLPGVDVEVGEVRSYPYGEVMAHVVGYVGAVSRAEKDKSQNELSIPGFRIGKNGVEKQCENILRGTAGNVQMEMNARGQVVRELARRDPIKGNDVTITIDAGLQQAIQQRFSEEVSASAVVIDVHTGAIRALVSHPSFDPNLFTYGISKSEWDVLNNDERKPLLNKALDGLYAPGSTFKLVTALAGLESGIISPDTTVFCPGYLELGSHKFHCWKKGGHGSVSFISAMAGSCDVYFYEIGRRIGIDKIHNMAKQLGLGQKTGIDMPHEKAGFVPNKAWKTATKNSSWQQGETLVSAIGQGYILTTPIQLAVMTARIASGGRAVKPHIIFDKKIESADSKQWPRISVNPDSIELLQEAMNAVVNEGIGTAYGARILDEKMAMAGKTGTSQVRRISITEREKGIIPNEERPWKERDHALFVGYAPVDNPRFATAVVVEHGGSGAHKAAPIARDILIECQKRK